MRAHQDQAPGTIAVMAAESRYLTQGEAAAYLRLSVRYLRDETIKGNIDAARIGKRLLYTVEDLDAYVRKHRGGGSATT